MVQFVGNRLKAIRKQKKITLKELSENTNLSIGLLSNVERDITSPTVSNLHTICHALNVSILDILSPTKEKLCVKKNERELIFSSKPDGNTSFYSMTDTQRELKCFCMNILDDEPREKSKHISDEIGIVISGTIDIIIENDVYSLSEGDTIYIPAETEHTFKKSGKKPTIMYWINKDVKNLGQKKAIDK